MRRVFLSLILIIVFAAALVVCGGYVWLKGAYSKPSTFHEERIVLIEKGMGVAAIALYLQRQGVVKDARVFRFGDRLFGAEKPLRAGEYRIPANASPAMVADVLKNAEQVVYKTTIAEGLTSIDIVDFLSEAPVLTGGIMSMPDEGSLLPETYHFHRGETRQGMVKRMTSAMQRAIDDLWETRAAGLPLTSPYQAIILASIVEKETGVAAERGKVAGVFINRLNKGMRLQSDPTVVYGITNGAGPLGRPLSRADLNGSTPYNTYQIKGLPPTPIANPGLDALKAVLKPEQTDALYFVADGTGGHAFARTLDEHNRNVRAWRKFKKQN